MRPRIKPSDYGVSVKRSGGIAPREWPNFKRKEKQELQAVSGLLVSPS
jgi:hypothetical protein